MPVFSESNSKSKFEGYGKYPSARSLTLVLIIFDFKKWKQT